MQTNKKFINLLFVHQGIKCFVVFRTLWPLEMVHLLIWHTSVFTVCNSLMIIGAMPKHVTSYTKWVVNRNNVWTTRVIRHTICYNWNWYSSSNFNSRAVKTQVADRYLSSLQHLKECAVWLGMQFIRATQVNEHLHNCQFSDTNHSWLFGG